MLGAHTGWGFDCSEPLTFHPIRELIKLGELALNVGDCRGWLEGRVEVVRLLRPTSRFVEAFCQQ
jgi:hypothetical protein